MRICCGIGNHPAIMHMCRSWLRINAVAHTPRFIHVISFPYKQCVVHQFSFNSCIKFRQICRLHSGNNHIVTHKKMSVLYRIKKSAIIPFKNRFKRINGLHLDSLLHIVLQMTIPIKLILFIIRVEMTNNIPPYSQVGNPDSFI